jgi:hypothetical protein
MAFAQLTYRESLRDIEACLEAVPERRYHLGFRSRVTRSTLADANERRDWRIYAAFAHLLIAEARRLYADEPLDVELKQTVYALDSTTIDLCLALFPWAHAHRAKGAVKIHTLLDLRGAIPAFLWITEGNVNDVRILDRVLPEPGAIYLVDRGYIDYGRLHRLSAAHAVFVTRAKRNLQCRRLHSHPVDRTTGLISVYVLVAILRKRLAIQRDLYTMLQLLSVYAFEKVPLPQLLSKSLDTAEEEDVRNQLPLFDF